MILDGMQGSPNCPEGTDCRGYPGLAGAGAAWREQHGRSSMEGVGTKAL